MRELPSEFQVPLWGPAMLPHGRRSIPFNHFVIKLYSLLQPRQKMINQHQTKHNGSVLFAKKNLPETHLNDGEEKRISKSWVAGVFEYFNWLILF